MMDWATELKNILPDDMSLQRPFVCDGFPHLSTILIVGENPGRQLPGAYWWNWWDEATGFDYEKFLDEYLDLKNGRVYGTRRNLAFLRNDCNIKAVETNIYRNEKPAGAGSSIQRVPNDDVLSLLVKGMPALTHIVMHGDKAKTGIPAFLQEDKRSIYIQHLSRGWSYHHLAELAAGWKGSPP